MKIVPTGKEQVKAVVHGIDRLTALLNERLKDVAAKRQALAEANDAFKMVQAQIADAEEHLERLLHLGQCSAENGCTHMFGSTSEPDPTRFSKMGAEVTERVPPAAPEKRALEILADTSKPISRRIALALLEHPILDYAGYGRVLWGPDVPFKTVKNRLSTNLAILCAKGVAESLGSNRFRIDPSKLAEKASAPVTGTTEPFRRIGELPR